uniref:Variant surface glycoprotein 1125.2633 n=1 Tax=Trypanosoma brucei TaxID=5691 RepID=A0A1J0R8J5_9TRYP|nr:variant surface glycoprotein 1125.2633 [Trypanosoma brucei]
MCAASSKLAKVSLLSKKQTETLHTTYTNFVTPARQLKAIAQQTYDPDKTIVLLAVSSELDKAAAQIEADLKTRCEQGIQAAATTGHVIGGISEFLNLLTAAQDTSHTGGCLSANDTNGNLVSDRQTLTGCVFDTEEIAAEGADEIKNEFTGIKIAALTGGDVKETTNANTKCVLFQSISTASTKLFQKNADFVIAGGTLRINNGNSNMDMQTGINLQQHSTKPGGKTILQAAKDADAVVKAGTNPVTVSAAQKVKQIISSGAVERAVIKAITAADNTVGAEQAKARAEAAITVLFGKNGDDTENKWSDLIATKINNTAKTTPAMENANTVNTETELPTILLQGEAIRAFKLRQTTVELAACRREASKKADTKVAEDVCGKIKEETECNSKSFCSYNKSASEGDKRCV